MKHHDSIETEVKVAIPSTCALAPALESQGFRMTVPPQPEQSTLWDRGDSLFSQGCALRLRAFAGKAILTWKGPKQADPLLKIRPELETLVADPQAMEGILRALGFEPRLAMEKTRSVWHREDLEACLDETPFGCYLELEGEASAIHRTMEALTLDPAQVETRSYPTLYLHHGLA